MKKLILFVLPILLFACSVCNVVKQTSIQEIQFGYGGGVAQSVTKYSLKPNGQLYMGQKVIGKVDKRQLLDIYKEAAAIENASIDSPSNTFSFINIVKSDTTVYYCWNILAPISIMELDKKLNNLLPK